MKRIFLFFVGLISLSTLLFTFQNCSQPLEDNLDFKDPSSSSADINYFPQALDGNFMFNQGKSLSWSKGLGTATHNHVVKFIKPATIQVQSSSYNDNTNPNSSSILRDYNLDQLKSDGCQTDLAKEGTSNSTGLPFQTFIKVCLSSNQFILSHYSIVDGVSNEDKLSPHFKYDFDKMSFIDITKYVGSGNGVWDHTIYESIINNDLTSYVERNNVNNSPTFKAASNQINTSFNGCQNFNFIEDGTILADSRKFSVDLRYCINGGQMTVDHVSTIDGVIKDPSPTHLTYELR